MQGPSKTTVRFPNLFAGFLDGKPTVNANYDAVKAASEMAIHQYVYTRKSQRRALPNASPDLSYSLLGKSEELLRAISLTSHLSWFLMRMPSFSTSFVTGAIGSFRSTICSIMATSVRIPFTLKKSCDAWKSLSATAMKSSKVMLSCTREEAQNGCSS
jgi:hypothetical protein